ncbi:hypothetical protein N7U49_03155 [Streptomyces sp. AD2-2]|nr:hypothetical protein N7U49_03155 [Streptomyces sp. AD2-2]
MLRAAWVTQPDGGLLLLHLHHVAVDGWSLNLLLHDLTDACAEAGERPSPALTPSTSPAGNALGTRARHTRTAAHGCARTTAATANRPPHCRPPRATGPPPAHVARPGPP